MVDRHGGAGRDLADEGEVSSREPRSGRPRTSVSVPSTRPRARAARSASRRCRARGRGAGAPRRRPPRQLSLGDLLVELGLAGAHHLRRARLPAAGRAGSAGAWPARARPCRGRRGRRPRCGALDGVGDVDEAPVGDAPDAQVGDRLQCAVEVERASRAALTSARKRVALESIVLGSTAARCPRASCAARRVDHRASARRRWCSLPSAHTTRSSRRRAPVRSAARSRACTRSRSAGWTWTGTPRTWAGSPA